jgi:uncharacterized protein (TIGR02284 family)
MQDTSRKTIDRTIDVLNNLIETARDGQLGFQTAAEGATAPELKGFFSDSATERANFATELSRLVTTMGGEPHETGHVAGAMHRGWINIKTAVSGNDDKAILEEAERGEDYAKKAFADALAESLPAEARSVVERMAKQVLQTHDRVRDLRNEARAAAK